MRIVFFGTPEFAVPSLQALIDTGVDIQGVVTQPDRPQGRSRSRLVAPPVKELANESGLPVIQPEKPNTPEFLDQLKTWAPDLGIVVAYGHILKPAVLEIPQKGMLNVHASILPSFRGAAPIQYSILNGDTETGVSVMQMEAGMDSGPVAHCLKISIDPKDTTGSLQPKLAAAGATALLESLHQIENGTAKFVTQNHAAATMAPKVTRETARIDWKTSPDRVVNLVRAMDPSPGAWALLADQPVKFFGAEAVEENESRKPGEVVAIMPRFVVATGEGAVGFSEIQPPGKARMSAADWTRGRGAAVGGRFA